MSYIPETPITQLGRSDEAPVENGPALPTLPDLKTNFALNEDVAKEVVFDILPILQWCRSNRKPLEEEWKAVRRMLLLQHDEGQRYVGRSNAYVPVYARTLQTLVSQVSRGLFPSDEYMDVNARNSDDPEAGRPVKEYIQYELEKPARLRTAIKPFLREFFNFGIAVGKCGYQKKKQKGGKHEGRLKKLEAFAQTEPEYKEVDDNEGFRFHTRSVFNWYVYPTTVADLDEATVIFEDIIVSRAFMEEMIAAKEWENGDAALNAPVNPDHQQNIQDALDAALGSSESPTENGLGNSRLASHKTLTEIWTTMKLPKEAYLPDEEEGCPLPVRILLAGNVVLQVQRNPLWTQKHPYVCGRMDVLPGSFYPKGTGHLARSLQYLVNDFTNQLNDNGTYALNPIVKVNPGSMVGPLPPIRPGVLWQTLDPNGITFDRPPSEQLRDGHLLVNTYASMLQDYAGAPPAIQGVGAGKAAKTATGAQILQRNAMSPLQDIVEDLEQDVMVRLMHMAWVFGQQFREGTVMDQIAGASIKVPKEALAGDFVFRWLASSQAVNQQQRAQQAISLLQVIQPLVPLLMQLGYVVDPMPLLKRVYSDGFGFRGFDQFLRRQPQQPQMGPGGVPGQPGAPVGPEQQQLALGNARSALEQAAGGGTGDMVPGEGEEFANVRDGADNIAALFGSGG